MKRLVQLLVVLLAGVAVAAPPKTPTLPIPPEFKDKVRQSGGEWGWRDFAWEGVAVVHDPVNNETLYLGGRHGGAEFGSLGNWAVSADGQTWRELDRGETWTPEIRDRLLRARGFAKDAESAARNLLFAGLPADKLAVAAKAEPAELVAKAIEPVKDFQGNLNWDKTPTWARELQLSAAVVDKAVKNLQAARELLSAGKLDADVVARLFASQWALDEAADIMRAAPGPRFGGFAGYDPANRCVVLFGGSHGDYVLSDTWIYDCTKKMWRQVWLKLAPSPRMYAPPKGTNPTSQSDSMKWDDATKTLKIAGGMTVLNKMVYQQGYRALPADEWSFDAKTGQWSSPAGDTIASTLPAGRTYRSDVCPAYDPRWYDAAGPGDPAAVADRIAKLPANAWVQLPEQERPAPERDWGTAVYDPDRDQIYRWTGGHCADPGNNVSTYHLAVDRWSIPYVPEISGKGMSFAGRPDCMNHTYLHYAYDPVSKRLVCTSMGGAGVYNPDRGEWDFTIAQPFCHHIYETCTVGTPKGVIVWTPGFFGLLDVATRQWKKLPVQGKLPRTTTDGSAVCYDAKRDCLWMASHAGYQKPSGNIWQYDCRTGAVRQMDPVGKDALVAASREFGGIRESVFVSTLDLVLFNNFVSGREVAYDPAGNRWVLLGVARASNKGAYAIGGVSDTLNYDPKRDVVWNLASYKRIYVLKLDAKTLRIDEMPAPSATTAPAGK